MKRLFASSALSLALLVGTPAAFAKGKKPKHTPEHASAIKQCNDTYKTAMKQAKSQKGQARKDAQKAARDARKQCITAAPQ